MQAFDTNPVMQLGEMERTAHFSLRQAQRKVSDTAVALALQCGEVFFQHGDRVYFLGRNRIPSSVPVPAIDRFDGTTVIVGPGDVLITAFRNPLARKALKRRSHGVRS